MKADQPTADERDSLPKNIYVVPDPDATQMWELYRNHGKEIAGTPVVVEVLFTRREHIPVCEQCREEKPNCYRLADDWAGVPVCRDCLESVEWTKAVVDDESELAEIDAEVPDELP